MKKTLILKYAAVGIVLMIAASILGLLGTYTHTDMEPLYLSPGLDNTVGWDIYTMENGSHRQLTIEEALKIGLKKTLYLSRTLTQEQENSGYTFLRLSSNLPCAVFLDDTLLYTTCPDSAHTIEQVLFPDKYNGLSGRGEAVRCTLPAHFAGKKLTIATTLSGSENHPAMPGIILSSEAIESENAMVVVSSEMVPAVGFAITALLLIIVWLFAFLQGVHNYQILLPIMAALLQAFSHLQQLAFQSASYTALDSPLAQFIPAVSLLLPLVYFLLLITKKPNRIIFGCILGISAIVAFICPVANLFGGLPFYSTFLEQNDILFFPIITLFVFTVWEVKHGNTELRLFLSGLGIMVFGIATLYVGSLSGEKYYANHISSVFKSMSEHALFDFWNWCAVILFLLSALISLYKTIQHTVLIHTSLALQTERLRQLDRQLSAQKNFYDARLSHEKEIRSLRHDMDGHLSTLSMLLHDDKLEEAKNYLNGITDYHNRQKSKLFSSNPYINVILQNYAAKCEEQHIEFVCHIGIGEQELPATELCLILNNALDNAIDASLALPEADRKIKVQATIRQNLFLLRISNPFHGNIKTDNGLPVTTKCGKEHGYGLSNIRQAAERRNGSMEYYVENGYFVLDVEFPL